MERVPESLHGTTFDMLLERHPLYAQVHAITKEREAIMVQLASGKQMARESSTVW